MQFTVIPLLFSLPPSVVFAILNACVNAPPVFLARRATPSTAAEALQAYDCKVTNGLTALMGLTDKTQRAPFEVFLNALPA